MGGKQVSLLNSIQKLLSSYSEGVGSGSTKSGDSSSSNVSTRRSSLTDLLKGAGSSGKGSPDRQVSDTPKEKSEDKEKGPEVIEESKEEGSKEGLNNRPIREPGDKSRLKVSVLVCEGVCVCVICGHG